MKFSKGTKSNNRSGFSLAELLVATSLAGAAMAMVMGSFIFILRFSKTDEGKLQINRDIRSFTNELSNNASFANTFSIYKSFTDRTLVSDTQSGDFLLLEFRDKNDSSLVSRIVGYYRVTDGSDDPGPVQTFTLDYSTPSDQSALTLIPSTSSSGTHTVVAELSQGLADGSLFFNFRNSSIVIRGELIHDIDGTTQVSNTYNFTISPRG
ncbi:type II secretion system GspH family protein [Puniceicoccaceae bacterium K14]|nr:type II secretion system GspH family protein [Puniceicoccaceae bacterium K14]